MVKITKEGKEINEKNQSLVQRTPQPPIQFIFKPSSNKNSSGVAGIGSLMGTHIHLNRFHEVRAVTAALETKGPPIDNRSL
jgi:hypothetical protein